MKRFLTIIIILSFRLVIYGQENMNAGIIYGSDIAFSLTAPKGWVLDNKSAVDQGIYDVFYRHGESWKDAVTVMYANIASFEHTPDTTLEQLIEYDINNFKSHYSDINITDGKDIIIKSNLTAKVKYLSGKSYGNFEAMAYIDAGKAGVMIIMSSRTKKDFDNSLIAFENLVKSYFLVANHIIIENKNK